MTVSLRGVSLDFVREHQPGWHTHEKLLPQAMQDAVYLKQAISVGGNAHKNEEFQDHVFGVDVKQTPSKTNLPTTKSQSSE